MGSHYDILVDTRKSAKEIRDLLTSNGIQVVSIGLNERLYSVDLFVDGLYIDGVDMDAFDEDEALKKALMHFQQEPDYDVIKASDITLDMLRIE